MDLSDISKVASRKRMNADVEKLREKVSHETGKIIKLKVAQDTAYWELRERLQAAERARERMRGNMLGVQMEHEAASARHQDELRRRPEALAALAAQRAVCSALQHHAARLRGALQRGAADRAALAAAYDAAAATVAAARADHERRARATAADARALRDRAALSEQHAARLAEAAAGARRHAEEAASEARAQLAADAARLRDERDALAARAARGDALLEERERTIGELRDELRAAAAEVAARDERARAAAAELQREAGAAAELREALAAAEARGAAAAREAVALRTELQAAREDAAALRREGEEAQKSIDESKRELKSLLEKNEELVGGLDSRDRSIRALEESVLSLQRESSAGAEERARLAGELQRAAAEREAAAAAAERELAARAATIAGLMRDVADADAALRAARADHAAAVDERARAEAAARTKEQEAADQMTVILDMRAERERLQEKIRGMQGTIDNIHKEVSREPGAPRTRDPPEHDDNAVAAPPARARPLFAEPAPRAPDAHLYSFLSDGSMDSDALDPAEVSRRFEALSRGAALPATTLRALKRSAAAAPGARQAAPAQAAGEAAGRVFFKSRRADARHKNKK